MSWNTRQRNKYLFGGVLVLALLIGIPTFFILQGEDPTCSDNIQNQGEKGVDCGGPCKALCGSQVTDLNILWSRSFKVVDGVYNAVAYIENPNLKGGIRSVPYTIKLRDRENIIVAERRGTTYVPPGTVVPVFEPSINTGERTPFHTTFNLREDRHDWIKLPDYKNPLEVQNIRRNLQRRSPKIEAEIKNTSIDKVSRIYVVATVFNDENNAIGASKTIIPQLPGGKTTSVVFTWPRRFEDQVVKVDIKAVRPISTQ